MPVRSRGDGPRPVTLGLYARRDDPTADLWSREA